MEASGAWTLILIPSSTMRVEVLVLVGDLIRN